MNKAGSLTYNRSKEHSFLKLLHLKSLVKWFHRFRFSCGLLCCWSSCDHKFLFFLLPFVLFPILYVQCGWAIGQSSQRDRKLTKLSAMMATYPYSCPWYIRHDDERWRRRGSGYDEWWWACRCAVDTVRRSVYGAMMMTDMMMSYLLQRYDLPVLVSSFPWLSLTLYFLYHIGMGEWK